MSASNRAETKAILAYLLEVDYKFINAYDCARLTQLGTRFFHRWNKHKPTFAQGPVIEVTHSRESVGKRRYIRPEVDRTHNRNQISRREY